MTQKNLILCIGGGKESLIGIKTAKRMGLKIVLVDKSKRNKAKKLCKYFIHESTKNHFKIFKKIRLNIKKKIIGVISFGNDVSETVNSLAKSLGLHHYNLKAARILSDKILTRKFLKKNKINSTPFFEIYSFNKLKQMRNKFKNGVLKPADSSGARGVYFINNKLKNLKKIFNQSISFSKKKICIFEKFIDGQQLSTETIIYNYKAYTVGISDRNYERIKEFSPSIIEDGSDMPSKFEKKIREKVNKLMLKVSKKLKINNCILKGDLVIKNNKIYVVEIAGRLSGGNFSSVMIPNSIGVNLLKCAIKLSINKTLSDDDLKIKYKKYISQRFFFTKKQGILKGIHFPIWAKRTKKIIFKDFNYSKGDYIKKITNHTNRLGQIIVRGKNKKKAALFANQVIKQTKFNIL